jgi:hypothetical protein
MTKSRVSLRNLIKRGLLLNIYFIIFLAFGCYLSTTPTYIKEDIDQAIQDICKNEYNIDVKLKLVGSTLWIYLPVEDMLEKADKPEKYLERFAVEDNKVDFKGGTLKLEYLIKNIPEKEKIQEYKYNKLVFDKINSVWKVLRRVLFSMERSREGNEPKFFCLVTADIKNGFETREIFYYLDLKKVSYEFISWTEYQHRIIEKSDISPQIIGDTDGLHLDYRDITLEEFVALQIQHRVKLKFQKPEVDKNADIDKEILKIVIYTVKTYNLRDFLGVELDNLLTQNRIVLNQAALWARPIE